ncbi:MAG: hypothetical protein ACXAEX_21055 [Promethearchaeota archaeon]|jgi:hypothetical protein
MRLYKIREKGELIKLDRLAFEENDVYLVDDEEKNTIFIWVGLGVLQEKKDITAEIARKIDKERGGSTKILIMKEKREYGSFLAMMHDLRRGLIPGVSIERRPEFVFEAPPESIRSVGLDGTPEEREVKPETRIVAWLKQIKEHRTYQKPEEEEIISIAAEFVRFEKPPVELKVEEDTQIEIPPETELEEDTQIEIPPDTEVEKQLEEEDFETHIREAAYFLSLKKYSYNELCWLLSERIQKISLDLPSIEDIKRKAEEIFNSGCTYDELCWLNAEMEHLVKKSFLETKKKGFY